MAKPIKQVVKTTQKALKSAISPVAKAVLPKPTEQMAGQQLAAAQAEPEKIAPKSAVSLGGEDQMRSTRQQTRRRRAAGVVTGSRGLTSSARTEKKSLLGQ